MEKESIGKDIVKRLKFIESRMQSMKVGTPNYEAWRKERKALILSLNIKNPFRVERIKGKE